MRSNYGSRRGALRYGEMRHESSNLKVRPRRVHVKIRGRIGFQPASPDYVLAVLQDEHRQQCQHDWEADPDVVLTNATTIAVWRDACDLVDWRELAEALNHSWDLDIAEDAWNRVLEPANEKTLDDVCKLVARHALQPAIPECRLLGSSCRTGGTFLAIRSLLADAGADVERLKPSCKIAWYSRHHLRVFLGPVSRLCPGALPAVQIETPAYDRAVTGVGAGLLGLLLAWLLDSSDLGLASLVFYLVCYLLVFQAARREIPRAVTFGSIETFGDLARVLAQRGLPARGEAS